MSHLRFPSLISLCSFGALILLPVAAKAQVYAEVGDTGDLPGTAQLITGVTPLTGISGTLAGVDIDMFGFHINGGGEFTALVTAGGDSQLFLFNSAGFGILANDDNPSGGILSRISGPLLAGDYFLAISVFNNDPHSSGGLIFPNQPFSEIVAPTPPGGNFPIASWPNAGGSGFSYTISLTGASRIGDTGVPGVPDDSSSLVLISMGMLALLGMKRRVG